MVGDFRNTPQIDLLTQELVLKPEYVGAGEIIQMAGQVLVIFDTESTEKEMYPYFFKNGLDYLFIITEKI